MGNVYVWESPREQTPDAVLAALERRISDLEQASVRLPIVNGDPSANTGSNVWVFADGRLRARMPDGTVREYRPYDEPNIPTLSADPAADSPIKAWLTTGGELRVRAAGGAVQRFAPVTTTSSGASGGSTSTSSVIAAPAYVPQTYVREWSADWWQSYKGDGSQRATNDLYYGKTSYYPANGRHASQWGFNDPDIRAALAGASIRRVDLYLENLHAHFDTGVELRLGGHSNDGKPGAYGGVVAIDISVVHYPKVSPGNSNLNYRQISNWFGDALRDNVIKGMLIQQNTDSNAGYGYARGGTPKIRIEYVK